MEVYVKFEFSLYILLCLKRNFMYANSTVTNSPVPNSIVISEEISTTEGSTLILKNSPEVVILEGSTLTITEDKELRLTCKVEGSPHIKSMFWSMMDKKTMFDLYEINSTLVIPKVNRNNSGVYICHAETKVGKGTANISLTIQYPPEVNVITVTSHFGKTRLDCLARGVPTSYTYSRWKHKSMFGEHIRYLDGFENGTLLIENKSKLKSYQDNGVYVCHVSNGVLNSNGSVVQMGEYVLREESQPVFAMQTKKTQFEVDGQMASLIFHLYGYPPAKEVYIFAADDKTEKIQINEIKIKNATVLDSFHGVAVHAIGYTINFEFGRLNEMDFRNYTIIAYNSHGNSKFDFEIIPASVEERKTSGPSFPVVVLLVSIVAGIVDVVFVILTIIIFRP